MGPAAAPQILLGIDAPEAADDVRRLLEQADLGVTSHLFGASEPPDMAAYQMVVLDGCRASGASLQLCRRLRNRLADSFLPILLVIGDHDPRARLATLEAGADAYLLRPFAPGELLAQVRTFLRLKDRHDRLSEKTAEVHRINQRLQRTYLQIDEELELARRIQRSFLPQKMPELPDMSFAVHYRPSGRVGGDFYDIFRLDEAHLGFYVADAMGHGIPASLLTIFVKKGVLAKEIFGKEYRLLSPSEVLQRLNKDLIEQALSETPFITMVYILLNHREGTLSFARSGHPYPVYLPFDGPPELWEVEGSLMGVFDTAYPTQARCLRPGDKLLLHTDGFDSAAFADQPLGTKSLMACADQHRNLPIQELVRQVAQDLFQEGNEDDLTLLGVERRLLTPAQAMQHPSEPPGLPRR
jgi:sigma-B regulation protein RsbU (phosphoserine phosphatase)